MLIDLNRLSSKTGITDNEILKELLEELISASLRDIEDIDKSLLVDNYDQIYRSAHSIKGASKSLWIEEIGSVSEQLESSAKQIDKDKIELLIKELKDLINRLKNEFDQQF